MHTQQQGFSTVFENFAFSMRLYRCALPQVRITCYSTGIERRLFGP